MLTGVFALGGTSYGITEESVAAYALVSTIDAAPVQSDRSQDVDDAATAIGRVSPTDVAMWWCFMRAWRQGELECLCRVQLGQATTLLRGRSSYCLTW